jgi:hypothetical protein
MDKIFTFQSDTGAQCSIFKVGRGYLASLSDRHRFLGMGSFMSFGKAVRAAGNWVGAVENLASNRPCPAGCPK